MAAVAFGGMRRYAAVRLYPLVVVRQQQRGVIRQRWLLFSILYCTYSIFNFAFFCPEELGTARGKIESKG